MKDLRFRLRPSCAALGFGLYVALTLALPGAALAQGQPAPAPAAAPAEGTAAAAPARPEEIEGLIKTLDDAQARDALKRQLQLLLQAQQPAGAPNSSGAASGAPAAPAPAAPTPTAPTPTAPTPTAAPPDGLGAQMLATLSDHVEKVSTALVNLVEAALDLPQRIRQTMSALSDPQVRAYWIDTIADLVAIIGGAFVTGWVARHLLAGLRRNLDGRRSERLSIRLLFVPIRLIVEVLPIIVFGIAGYVMLPLLDPNRTTRLIALAVINAQIAVSALSALAEAVLAARAPGLRPFRSSDETAAYLQIWVRRVAVAGIYGFVVAELALLLGLDPVLHEILLRAFGLLVGAMAIIIVLQNRVAIARGIGGPIPTGARPPDESEADFPPTPLVPVSRLTAFRRQAARFWHVLAIAYIVAAYAVWSLQIEGGFTYLLRATALTAVLGLFVRLADGGLRRIFERSFALSDDLRMLLPGLEDRANRYLPVFRQSILVMLYVCASLSLLQIWGIDVFGWLSEGTGREVAVGVVKIAIILVLALLLSEAASAWMEHYLRATGPDGELLHRGRRAHTLLPLLRNVFRLNIGILVTLMTLSEIGIDIAPLLAGAGVVGLAVGFGAQTLIKDVITGVFILIEDTVAVGDAVDLGGHVGTVEAMTLRTIKLRDGDGAIHTVPFSAVSSIVNTTRDFSNAIFDVAVAYDQDVDRVIKIIKQVGEELRHEPAMKHQILQPIAVLGLDSMQNGAMVIKATMRTRPSGKWDVIRAFNLRLKRAFDEKGIAMPFPQRLVQMMPASQPAAAADEMSLAEAKAVQEARAVR